MLMTRRAAAHTVKAMPPPTAQSTSSARDAAPRIERIPRREHPRRTPTPSGFDPGLVLVDATWGAIQPLNLPGGVETVGELEVIAQIEAGGRLVDTRQPEYLAYGVLPGAIAISHDRIVEGLEALEPDGPAVLYCNGPQCTATPRAIASLLDAGWDPGSLRYYRGGIHDWVTLGLPLEQGR
jgi:rhodanese-related sulfurtransferase